MPSWWPAVVFGWPAVVLSLVVAVTGTAVRKPVMVAVAAALTLPFGYYLSGAANWIGLAGPAIPVTLAGSAYALHRGTSWVAWGLLAAVAAIVVLVSVRVWVS